MGFQMTGAALMLLFYGCYIVKMMAQRKKGIRTDQMGRGKTGAARVIELAVKAAAWGTAAAEAVSVLRNTSMFPLPARIVGAFAAVLGTAVFIASVVTMEGVAREERTALVTRGIYQFSRNPAFLGFDLLYTGMAAMFCNWVLLVVSVLAVVMLHLQVVEVEERFLAEAFGAEYLEYRERVCRYIGRRR